MKVRTNGDNIIPLNKYALKILDMQRILNGDKKYIFANNNGTISENFCCKIFKFYNLEHIYMDIVLLLEVFILIKAMS